MIKSTLNAIRKLLASDTECDAEELFKEAMLMVLSRATNVDSNIDPVEVTTVVDIVSEVTGDIVSSADVRVAGQSELYESASLERYCESVASRISRRKRVVIAQTLAKVILVDKRVTRREVYFFNMVCNAFSLRPSDLMGLVATQAV